MDNKSVYRLLTRTQGPYSKIVDFFQHIITKFGWRHLGLAFHNYKASTRREKSDCSFVIESVYNFLADLNGKKPYHAMFNEEEFDEWDVLFDQLQVNCRGEMTSIIVC